MGQLLGHPCISVGVIVKARLCTGLTSESPMFPLPPTIVSGDFFALLDLQAAKKVISYRLNLHPARSFSRKVQVQLVLDGWMGFVQSESHKYRWLLFSFDGSDSSEKLCFRFW